MDQAQRDKLDIVLAISQVISLSEFIGHLGARDDTGDRGALERFTEDRAEHMAKIRALLDL